MIYKIVDTKLGKKVGVRRTRPAVVITRGRHGSLYWCPDPRKQECAADRLGVSDYKFTEF